MLVERDAGGEGGSANNNPGRHDGAELPRKLVALARPKKEAKQICTEEQYWDLVG
jgi:hypothetical protein